VRALTALTQGELRGVAGGSDSWDGTQGELRGVGDGSDS
jgi:hypothetical protein